MSQVRCDASGCDRGRIKCDGPGCKDGYYKCPKCKGGKITCTTCHGERVTRYGHADYQGCPGCGGRDHGPQLKDVTEGSGWNDCPDCDDGKIRCATCGRDGGHGTVTCKDCGGTGWVDPK